MTEPEWKKHERYRSSLRERRKNFRVSCPLDVDITLLNGESEKEHRAKARILDLSLGGIRVSFYEMENIAQLQEEANCRIRFFTPGKELAFRGRIVGIYNCRQGEDKDHEKKTLEAGIRFEGLSVEDQFDLVHIFGKIRTPMSF